MPARPETAARDNILREGRKIETARAERLPLAVKREKSLG
jgi:hypothetical protein